MVSATINDSNSAIAIVGLSCRFPGDAATPSGFWDLLKNGLSGFSESTNRYNAEAFHHPQTQGTRQNVIPVKGGYFLKQDPYVFDAAFFNITATEAMALDPRQRIAMEVAYEALESAGMPLQKVKGTQTACFLGVSMSDYRDAVSRDFGNFPKYQILGVSDEMIANRISHFLDIHGPSATVQSACSSSLVATHVACQSLRSGESSMAIAGGVGLITLTDGTMHLTNLGFLNPKGHSMSFDADANGYGRGEGCGIVISKRLDDAIRDGDTIRAVIRGTGVNSDGWTQGVTMPSLEAQAALITQVYERNGLDYGSTQYVEAHGTGTKVGDPIETNAIHRTIGQPKTSSRKRLFVGSVKANIGHLEAAAGVASIIKGVLSLERGLIPPNINFSKPNPAIPLDEWNMAVPTKLTPWPAAHTKRMSINGFGMGGTNGHVVMDAYNAPVDLSNGVVASRDYVKRLFVLSSHDEAGLKRVGQSLAKHLENATTGVSSSSYLANLAHTLGKARSGLAWKATCVAENVAELREQLTTTVGEDAARVPSTPVRIGFVFTGQGAQWARMGIEMLERPVFSASMAKSAKFLKEMGCDWDPVTELSKGQAESRLGVPEISQPICSVLQIALVDELRSWGVTPSGVVGHSSGEIGAAYTMGALSHRDALAAAYFRGTASAGLMKKKLSGGMMAVGCSQDEMQELMKETKLKATVACVNSPSNVTVSGDVVTLDALKVVLDKRNVFARRLKVEVAYHSPHMHLCSGEYYASIADVGQETVERQPVTMISSVLGHEVEAEQLGPYYWVQNLINPVLFADSLKEMVSPAEANGEKVIDLLVEIGPHSALGGPAEQILSFYGINNVDYTSMLVRGQSALDTGMSLAAEFFRRGVSIDVSKANGDSHCKLLTDLPSYAWNHSKKFNAISRAQREQYAQQFPTKSLLGAMMPTMDEEERVWRSFVNLDNEPWLRDHVAGPNVLFPAAGMVSIALEAAQQIVDAGKTPLAFKLRDISFLAAMAITDGTATEITVHLRPHIPATSGSTPAAWWEFTVSSCPGVTGQLRKNCRGLLSVVYEQTRSSYMAQEDALVEATRIADYHRILKECPETCTKAHFYERWLKSSMAYGETFQGMENVHPGVDKTCYEVKVVDIGETFTRGKLDRPFLVSPATLDTAWQGILGSRCETDDSGDVDFGFNKLLLPTFIGELDISLDIPADVGYLMPGSCRSYRHGFNEFSANINLYDKDLSKVLMSVSDFRLSQVETDDSEMPAEGGSVDPADITSMVHWNYALDVMEPAEISEAILSTGATTADDKLVQLVKMVIHKRPESKVVELVQNWEMLSDAVISKFPKGIILPTQVRYAVVNGAEPEAYTDKDAFGRAFHLHTSDKPSGVETTPIELFVIPHQVSSQLTEGLDSILELLFRKVKPADDAFVVMAAPAAAGSLLKAKGFNLVTSMPVGTESLFLCKYIGNKQMTNGNGVHAQHEKVTIFEPTTPSSEEQSFSKKLQDQLKDQGYAVTTKAGVSEADPIHDKVCVSLLELQNPMLENLSEPDFQSLRKLWVGCERLLWITGGSSPSMGMVDGLSRCVNIEVAGAKFQVLHLTSGGVQNGSDLVTRVLSSSDKTADNEFRELGGLLQVPRMYKSFEEDEKIRHHLEDTTRVISLDDNKASFRLTIGKPGLLDSLHFVREESELAIPLADNELELDIKNTGLNFRDVMASMGLVPFMALGQEASGIVIRTGSRAAESYKPGDRVSALSVGGTHATKARCDYRVAAKLPDTISFAEGAAAPMVHAAAYYALVKLAKLRHGQSVLVHAAAGGLGQAAVQLAKHLGLVIYVTVGTEDKRRFVIEHHGIPDEHIFNSRDASFAKGIQRVTGGRGVDCVLNSLSGELLRVSWTCLATFGTFVEVGLRDITDNMRLDMRPFSKSVTFTSLDIPTLIDQDPAAIGEALGEVFKLLHEGTLKVPQPLSLYPVGQIEQAFRTMQTGRHRGKIVLSFDQEDKPTAPVLCKAKDSFKLKSNATFLFVGGLGGLGRSLAREFVASGARHIAFISRSGDTKPEAKATIDELASHGAQVKVFACDVADKTSFLAAMEKCSQKMPPIKGVIQMAMVLRDVLIENMSYEEWTTPIRPKVQGTWNLHEYFGPERPLDFMIFCSSFSGLCGSPGQAQYGAGNTFQDALAHHRRNQGLKAISVNLGIMLSVGILAEMGDHTFKLWEDVLGIRNNSFHSLVKSLASQEKNAALAAPSYPTQVCLGLGTADIIATHRLPNPPWFTDPRFKPLTVASASASPTTTDGSPGATTATASLASRLSQASTNDEATAVITEALVAKIADILRIPASEIDARRPLYSYGVDSLVALELRNWITREIKANMALLDLLAAVPMEEFAGLVAGKSKLVVTA
ncbi:hypothetical protein BS50DRAFT_676305 [Corynespora cassiicola Philippines]|uniref:Uncharacterized protein n=1 Tax=Corynespora cassiicola Philippines TaxID=1448308 RepID=A0A2T2NST9_CORCC|nr:hypothetical protein BS50DRAFT_676305 [Corynespora cassiicola Philippines]